MTTIGVISDTHGLLRKEAIELLKGSDLILHAGDIGKQSVLEELESIAPVIAIRGNVDQDTWATALDETQTFERDGVSIDLIHNIKEIHINPVGRFDVVVSGHSHKPRSEVKNDVLYFNPGSAGPRRFKLPIALGKLTLRDGSVEDEIIII